MLNRSDRQDQFAPHAVLPTLAPAAPFLTALFAWDSLLFGMICLADMLTTLYWVHMGKASEANPLLARCLAHGTLAFCGAKLLSFLPLLLTAAYFREEYPKFVPRALRLGILGYLLAYFVGVASQFFL